MRVLEVSLRKAGFTVTTAVSVQDALDKLELHAPDLIISETTFPDGDGFELRRKVRGTLEWGEIPFIFLTAEAAIENKIRGLELGVDDYLTKPIYIKEIVTRINILLQKRQRVRFEERRDGRTRFAGRVLDMPVVDVIQTIEISRKSGVIQFVGDRGRQAAIYFRDGRVIDAEAGTLQGEDAVYRLLTWNEGEFEVVFRTVRRREVIQTSSQGLLMEGMRRLDEWSRLLEQLPALTHRFEVDAGELALRLGDVPDDNNQILRLIDGKRTLLEVIDSSDVGDLECLQAISRLYFEELLMDLDHGTPIRHPTGRPVPLVELSETPTPIEDAASGPHDEQAQTLVPAPEPSVAAAPVEETEPDVIGEEEVPGPLMGGFRPSSLRLIDEAVAAAQAIEPSLFEDQEDDLAIGARGDLDFSSEEQTPVAGPNGHAKTTNGVHATLHDASAENAAVVAAQDTSSVPHVIEADEPAQPSRPARRAESAPMRPDRTGPVERIDRAKALGRDDSGLRMIGSLGRDRAEASGELAPVGSPPAPLTETQRELVTILPRRITRELAVVPPPDEPPQSDEVRDEAPGAPPVELPRELPPPPRINVAGGVRRDAGPGAGALALIILAAILAGTAVYLRLRRTPKPSQIAVIIDAMNGSSAPQVTPITPMPPVPSDAGAAERRPARDAAPMVVRDAGAERAKPPASDAVAKRAEDTVAQARKLVDQANEAMAEGNFDKALESIDGALKLRRTARTYLLRAQILQRLERVDDALATIDAAERLAPGYSTIYELRGRILWAARRKDEARAQFEKFLQIEPSGPRAAQIQRLLSEPR
jgi:CheY-like chemotaxis protein